MADRQDPPSAAPPPVVSIWVGAFPSIDDAEAYFFKDAGDGSAGRCRFANDFALDAFDPACVEIRFERPTPRPIEQLLEDCTFSESFAADALAAAKALGIREAQGVALIYYADYGANSVVRAEAGPLKFLGSFPFADTSSSEGEASPRAEDVPYFQVAAALGYPSPAVFLVAEPLGGAVPASRRAGHGRGAVCLVARSLP